jgi:hypothetical protein
LDVQLREVAHTAFNTACFIVGESPRIADALRRAEAKAGLVATRKVAA